MANLQKIKYQFEHETIEPGFYTIHRPSQCNLKFPKTHNPIHKKQQSPKRRKKIIEVTGDGRIRQMIVHNRDKTEYPAIWEKFKYEKLKKQASDIEKIDINTAVDQIKQRIIDGEEKKKLFKSLQKPQPGFADDKNKEDENNEVSDILKRSAGYKYEEFQGARVANQIILASKCHAVQDAQIDEKALIKKEIIEEDKRCDRMMEEFRQMLVKDDHGVDEKKKSLKMEHINYIKKQIEEKEKNKMEEGENIIKEYNNMIKNHLITQINDIECFKEKQENAYKLKLSLDKCNEELRLCKEREQEENKMMERRIEKFIDAKKQRDTKFKAEVEAKKAARMKTVETIAESLKTEKDIQDELENIRMLKIQEEAERQYREKEKTAILRKIKQTKVLQKERNKQIASVRQQLAFEIAKDEELYKDLLKKNEEDTEKVIKKNKEREEGLFKYRKAILSQINEKEQKRTEYRQALLQEGRSLRTELEKQKDLEKQVIQQKIEDMRYQKIPEKYIREVEYKLTKLKLI